MSMEIYGIGTDIIEIDRIKQSLNRNLKLLDKLFSKNELEELKKKNYKSESIAGNFAAKEAVVKSVGTGLRGFNVKDIEILRDNLNKPVVVASGNFKIFLDENNIKDIKVSISHSKSYATATAIAIK
ncbi:holo-ACP synthase [Peptostreptococcus canis]|uniref:Holo-[acyl-carrier-protein] synthase n=2 Tax=Peptostreptococcus canis TaxID=1159213 RepID=A0ABR6TIQ4_9FIRM|nr:holo-ACP synthase [Peptostreptococcus canis]